MRVWLKRIALGLAGLLVIAVVVIAAMLIPAHMQIREIEPEFPSRGELLALMDEPIRPTKISYFNTSEQDNNGTTMVHSTFVIEWEDGRILLIDAGMDRDEAQEFSKLVELYFGAEPATVLGEAPEFLGDDIDRVAGIGFTHLHVDHVQGIGVLCEAASGEIAALQADLQANHHNLNTSPQADLIEDSACLRPLVLAPDQHITPEFPGIGIYPLGGHTPGSTLFAVPIEDRLWLLTGDISNSRADLIANRQKGWFYSTIMVPEHVDRLAQLRVLLTELDSDPQVTAIVSHDGGAIAESGMERRLAPTP